MASKITAVGLELTCMVKAFACEKTGSWVGDCTLSSEKGLRLSRRMSIFLSVRHNLSAFGISSGKLSATPLQCSSESATPDR